MSVKTRGRRTVLTRAERVKQLAEQGRWVVGDSVYGLPKVRSSEAKATKVPLVEIVEVPTRRAVIGRPRKEPLYDTQPDGFPCPNPERTWRTPCEKTCEHCAGESYIEWPSEREPTPLVAAHAIALTFRAPPDPDFPNLMDTLKILTNAAMALEGIRLKKATG